MPTGSSKGRSGKRKSKNVNCSKSKKADAPPFLIHGDGNSSKECRILKDYEAKYRLQAASIVGNVNAKTRQI